MPRAALPLEIGGHVFKVSGGHLGGLTRSSQAMNTFLQDEAIVPGAEILLHGLEHTPFAHPTFAADLLFPFERIPQLLGGDSHRVQLIGHVHGTQHGNVCRQCGRTFDAPRCCRRQRHTARFDGADTTQAFTNLPEGGRPLDALHHLQQGAVMFRPFGLHHVEQFGDGRIGPATSLRFAADQHHRDITLAHGAKCLSKFAQDPCGPATSVPGQDAGERAESLAQTPRGHPRLVHATWHTTSRTRQFAPTLGELLRERRVQNVWGHRGSMPSLLAVRVTRV